MKKSRSFALFDWKKALRIFPIPPCGNRTAEAEKEQAGYPFPPIVLHSSLR